ncbi:cytochrome P450 94A2-like [Silene latifolia]|uniref:cytochrome P450 94A2-like n=1 Tax=Silene latifolia TaxID=37657 RepID=UPI003D77F02B
MFEVSSKHMLLISLLLIFLTSLIIFVAKISKPTTKLKITNLNKLPKPYPIIGHLSAFARLTQEEIFEWLSKIISTSPTSTIVVHPPFGMPSVYTGDPATVEHVFKTQFLKYEKGAYYKTVFGDLFGDSMFTGDGDVWKTQRQIAGLEFTHKALQNYVEKVVNTEISERLIPFLSDAAKENKVIDLQDLLRRYAFDNVSTVAFGYNPGYVTPSLPDAKLVTAFADSLMLSHERFHAIFPIIWKVCRFLNIGSEKKLKESIRILREFIKTMIKSMKENPETDNQEKMNFLSRVVNDDRFDEKLTIDMCIAFILGGMDTSSAALTWFFWLVHRNKHVDEEIVKEIKKVKKHGTNNSTNYSSVVEELKGMTYTHAALCEAMRLYPPGAVDIKLAATDDVLPDGTKVKKGMFVGCFIHAMGRSEKIWGKDWPEFKPERWLREEKDTTTGEKKRSFVARDACTYPVFLAGPRICLGKEMGFLQMKSVVSAVLSRFRVVPVIGDGVDPVYVPETIAKMHGGFPVRFEERVQVE